MNYWLVGAAGLSAFVCLLHIFGGGPATVPQLITKEARPGRVGRMTAYYAWHMVTIVIAGQALAFWIAADTSGPQTNEILALFAAGGAVLFTIWSLAMIAIFRLKLFLYPQWVLFLPIGVLGFVGVYG